MKILMRIDKDSALRAGFDTYGWQVVDVPASTLTEEQRAALISRHTSASSDAPKHDYYLSAGAVYSNDPLHKRHFEKYTATIPAATPDAVRAALDKWIQLDKEYALEQERVKQEEAAKRRAEIEKLKQMRPEDFVDKRYSDWEVTNSYWHNEPELKDLFDAAKEIAAQRNRADAEERRKAKEEKERREEEGKKKLMDWAIEHGSELVKLRIMEHFEWEELAKLEYLKQAKDQIAQELGLTEAPGPDWDDYKTETEDENHPKLKVIRTWQRVRDKLPDYAKAELKRVEYTEKIPEDYYEEDGPRKMSRTELMVTITAPNLGSDKVYFLAE